MSILNEVAAPGPSGHQERVGLYRNIKQVTDMSVGRRWSEAIPEKSTLAQENGFPRPEGGLGQETGLSGLGERIQMSHNFKHMVL